MRQGKTTRTLRQFLSLFGKAYHLFKENHPVMFASAIAYFSLFALPSIFVILITVLSIFFSRQELLSYLQEQLAKVIGDDGGNMLVVITRNYLSASGENIFSIIFYTVVTYWLSTQLFRLFQNSLNDLWQVKPDFKNFYRKIYIQHIVPFFLVIITGLLFFTSTIVEMGIGLIASDILGFSSDDHWLPDAIINSITALIVVAWFALLYKWLPAVTEEWKPTLIGATLTAILFFIGTWALWYSVVERDLEELYDVAASIITIALWMFYTSIVFMYGACFTKAFTDVENYPSDAIKGAYKYKQEKSED